MPLIKDGDVFIYTHKAGLLAAAGHEHRFKMEKFEINADFDAGTVNAKFWVESVEVAGAYRNGNRDDVDMDALSDDNKEQVYGQFTGDLLDSSNFPYVTFEGTLAAAGDGFTATGQLEMRGQKKDLTFNIAKDGSNLKGEVELVPSQWGVPLPFSAMLGAMKVADKVELTFSVPDPR